jgi:hypothetical protein
MPISPEDLDQLNVSLQRQLSIPEELENEQPTQDSGFISFNAGQNQVNPENHADNNTSSVQRASGPYRLREMSVKSYQIVSKRYQTIKLTLFKNTLHPNFINYV